MTSVGLQVFFSTSVLLDASTQLKENEAVCMIALYFINLLENSGKDIVILVHTMHDRNMPPSSA